ncbi:hypothetical protein EUX98_g5791 [Antrodiella citrinella]|uniref:Uncharacterized protein n=1 Tax=Antrodiella citrinella TaxID=2447956 RepID=A0A4V3XI96_9APHY|nr:hypothetical protein EUX98_g5791 [Antrodiella citrinella]
MSQISNSQTERSDTIGRVQDTSYHSAPSKDSTALETDPTREYGDFDAGDHVGRHADVDAGAIHADRDRDAGLNDPTTREEVAEESNFGGENTDYGDVVSPEDDDERYGEALPAEMGGTGEGGAEGYEDTIGDGEPVDVGDTQAIFPGSDRW